MVLKPAVFFDRDGVINDLILNPKTGEFESPHHLSDLKFITAAPSVMVQVQDLGFELFVVSNQPSYAKGKTSLEEIKRIAAQVSKKLETEGVFVRDFFYCFHHPEGTVAPWAGPCECRKPKPYFLLQAAEKYGLDLKSSWMVGDQDTDVQCGQAAGCKTILIENPSSEKKRGKSIPNFKIKKITEVLEIIKRESL